MKLCSGGANKTTLRNTINMFDASTSIVACYNYTGTPYVNGDLVVVKKQVEANEGDIVVALVDNQNTLKRYFRDDENKKIILHPENKKMKDIIVDECCIQGVACHIIKELLADKKEISIRELNEKQENSIRLKE